METAETTTSKEEEEIFIFPQKNIIFFFATTTQYENGNGADDADDERTVRLSPCIWVRQHWARLKPKTATPRKLLRNQGYMHCFY